MSTCGDELSLHDHRETRSVRCSKAVGHKDQHEAKAIEQGTGREIRLRWEHKKLESGSRYTSSWLGCTDWVRAVLSVKLERDTHLDHPTTAEEDRAAVSPPYTQYCDLEQGHTGAHKHKLVRFSEAHGRATEISLAWK